MTDFKRLSDLDHSRLVERLPRATAFKLNGLGVKLANGMLAAIKAQPTDKARLDECGWLIKPFLRDGIGADEIKAVMADLDAAVAVSGDLGGETLHEQRVLAERDLERRKQLQADALDALDGLGVETKRRVALAEAMLDRLDAILSGKIDRNVAALVATRVRPVVAQRLEAMRQQAETIESQVALARMNGLPTPEVAAA